MVYCFIIFFFKQKTAYEMRISDWSSDVCSSDLAADARLGAVEQAADIRAVLPHHDQREREQQQHEIEPAEQRRADRRADRRGDPGDRGNAQPRKQPQPHPRIDQRARSEENTSELPSIMRHSSAGFCLKKTN